MSTRRAERAAASAEFWRGKRVLVTGNTGFKGSWLSCWLSRLGAEVHGYALAPETQPALFEAANVKALAATTLADVRDAGAVLRAMRASRCEIVFHLAAQPLVRESYRQPLETYAVNVMGTAHVLQAARENDAVRAIVCVTSDKCYENREWPWPYRENDPLGGHDPYSSSKACAEIVASSFARSFFHDAGSAGVATARGGNVVGGGDWSQDRIVPDLVRAFSARESAIVRNPHAVRPWQFVLDALHGYLLLAQRLYGEPKRFAGAWNFGPPPGSERTVAEIADRLAAAWGPSAHWRHAPESAVHEASLLKLDSSKARTHLGWRDLLPVEDAIAAIARWYTGFYDGGSARALVDEALTEYERRMEIPA